MLATYWRYLKAAIQKCIRGNYLRPILKIGVVIILYGFIHYKRDRTDRQVIATADKILMKRVIERSILAVEQPSSNL